MYQTTYDANVAELTTCISNKQDYVPNVMMTQRVAGQSGGTHWDTVKFRLAALLDASGNTYDIYLVREEKVQLLETSIQTAYNLNP